MRATRVEGAFLVENRALHESRSTASAATVCHANAALFHN
jgi:hypothetical protein